MTQPTGFKWEPVWVATQRKPPKWKRGWHGVQGRAQIIKDSVVKPKDTIGSRAVDWAETQVGYKESPPGSNNNKYGREAGENHVPWCGIFLATGWTKGGSNVAWNRILFWDYVPQIHSDARNHRHGLVEVKNLKRLRKGDAVGLWADRHVELFVRWANKEKTIMVTIGGNTGGSDPTNGGMVAKQERRLSDVSFGARLYK